MDPTTLDQGTVEKSLAAARERALAGSPGEIFKWVYAVERGLAPSARLELNVMKSWWRLEQALPLIRPGDRLLDAGCGEGTDSLVFTTLRQTMTVGVDLNQRRLERASTRARLWGRALGWESGRVRFEPMSVFNLAAEDASFDVVWCNQAIEHIHPLPPFFAEVRRVLRPGGWFAVANINALSPYAQARMFRRRGLRFFRKGMTDPRTGEPVEYAVELLRSPYRVRRQLRVAGFNGLRLSFMGCIPSPVARFERMARPVFNADRFLSATPLKAVLAYDYVVAGRKQ